MFSSFFVKGFYFEKLVKNGEKKSKKSFFSDSKNSTTMMISSLDRTAEISLDLFS